MFFPYKTDVVYYDNPISNIYLIASTILIFFLSIFSNTIFSLLILKGWTNIFGFVGYIFLHGSLLHLFGNMFILWIFGNAICSRYGNIKFIFFYLIVGIIAGFTHSLVSSAPTVGASGAVNGVLGAFLVLYPKNKVNIFVWFFMFFPPKTFRIPSIILILFWFLTDFIGATSGGGYVAYMAHIGGLISGVLITLLALKLGMLSHDDLSGEYLNQVNERKKNRADSKNHRATIQHSAKTDSFIISCPYCKKSLRANNRLVGKSVRCPYCSSFFYL